MKAEGYRYVRSYRLMSNAKRWALWEVINGRSRRVGTATTEAEYQAFLLGPARWQKSGR